MHGDNCGAKSWRAERGRVRSKSVCLALARRMGATLAIDPTNVSPKAAMAEVGMKEGYDVGLEMSGSSHAFTQLIDAIDGGG